MCNNKGSRTKSTQHLNSTRNSTSQEPKELSLKLHCQAVEFECLIQQLDSQESPRCNFWVYKQTSNWVKEWQRWQEVSPEHWCPGLPSRLSYSWTRKAILSPKGTMKSSDINISALSSPQGERQLSHDWPRTISFQKACMATSGHEQNRQLSKMGWTSVNS